MKHYLYTLTMPNNNAWNGKWTGESNLYCRVRTYAEKANILENIRASPSHYYNFGDGWGARVSIQEVDSKGKAKYNKISQGFCGYEWMIDEIEQFGRIKTRNERSETP